MATLQEGGRRGKPALCSDIEPARVHADLLGMEICAFDPLDPVDIGEKILLFEAQIDRYRHSAAGARRIVEAFDVDYTGRCYADVLRLAAGLASRPSWAPFLRPVKE